jgi:hypothetical protein
LFALSFAAQEVAVEAAPGQRQRLLLTAVAVEAAVIARMCSTRLLTLVHRRRSRSLLAAQPEQEQLSTAMLGLTEVRAVRRHSGRCCLRSVVGAGRAARKVELRPTREVVGAAVAQLQRGLLPRLKV